MEIIIVWILGIGIGYGVCAIINRVSFLPQGVWLMLFTWVSLGLILLAEVMTSGV